MLVVNDVHGVPSTFQPNHRTDEVRSLPAVQPGGPYHISGAGEPLEYRLLSCQLGAAVGGTRIRNGVLPVRLERSAVEHIVGGKLEQACAAGGKRLGEVGRAI